MICVECVNIESIKEFVSQTGDRAECDFCNKENISVDVETVFEKIDERAEDVLRPVEDLSSYEYGMVFEAEADDPHVFDAYDFFETMLCEDAVNKLMDWLPDNYNQTSEGHRALFALDDGTLEGNEFTYKWKQFIEGVNHGYRYFNQGTSRFLDELFETISAEGKLRPEVVKTFGSDEKFYRARLANTHNLIKSIEEQPHKELGPVPKEFAGNQRMTPAGISAMYCALDRSTCLSEIRPIVGDTVISVELKPTSELKFLDLSKLENLDTGNMDVLSEGFRQHANVCAFLKDMVFNLSKPLARQDELGYLSTQVFFEYLRVKYHNEVDGIFFPSVQCDGKGHNVALFLESSSVMSADGKNAVYITPDYYVMNNIKPKLQMVDDSLIFHKIKSVVVESVDEKDSFKLVADEKTLKMIYGRRA